jgi:hypothetical protein
MNILLETIAHEAQRYPTVGDWVMDGDSIRIMVSKMEPEDYSFLVALHELVEVWLCRKRGISQEAVDAFDIEFEKNRPEGNVDEPGDDPKAPYVREHQFATKIERLMAEELGVEWDAYNAAVENL